MKANYGYKDGSGEFFITLDTDRCTACGDGDGAGCGRGGDGHRAADGERLGLGDQRERPERVGAAGVS